MQSNVLSINYNVIIYRAICAPGHGKSIIDGLNVVDKHYIKRVMCMSGSNRHDNLESRMNMFAMIDKQNSSSSSFAHECARLCSLKKRNNNSDTLRNHSNTAAKVSARYYYVHQQTDVKFTLLSKGTNGWPKTQHQKRNGIQHHYNFRADPSLGLGYVAARRIPCCCVACQEQLKQAWLPHISFQDQPRYASNNKNCVFWETLGPLNNWQLISIVDFNNSNSETTSKITKSIFRNTLRSKSITMSSNIVVGNYAAISTTDEKTMSGYYICCITSNPYILQDNSTTMDAQKLAKGDLVCDITWLNQVPLCRTIFSHGLKDDTSLMSITRIQHIVDPDVSFSYLKHENQLPSKIKKNFNELQNLNAIIIDDACHDNIIEEINSRMHMEHSEYDEVSDDDIYSESDSDEEMFS